MSGGLASPDQRSAEAKWGSFPGPNRSKWQLPSEELNHIAYTHTYVHMSFFGFCAGFDLVNILVCYRFPVG